MRHGPYAAASPQSNFFRVDTLKKLARTANKFNRNPGPWVRAFLLQKNVDLKMIALKRLIVKNVKYSSG
jgi:hypothetical protein